MFFCAEVSRPEIIWWGTLLVAGRGVRGHNVIINVGRGGLETLLAAGTVALSFIFFPEWQCLPHT